MDNCIEITQVASTNDFLKEYCQHRRPMEGFAVFTPNQTAGKGQRGNSWVSEAGKNIILSIVFYPEFLPLTQNFLLSEAVALGVKDTLDGYLSDVAIKWPNDIYFGDKKIAGILIENEITAEKITNSIVGIGLNVNQENFVPEARNAISMKQILGTDTDIKKLSEKLLNTVRNRYFQLENNRCDAVRSDYHKCLYHRSGLFGYKDVNGAFNAEILSVADDGTLNLLDENGKKRHYFFKEISIN